MGGPTCAFSKDPKAVCPVRMDVSYIKKSYVGMYDLEYGLTPDNLEMFKEPAISDGTLK